MHVGIDATCWHNQRGYGRHLRALVSHMVTAAPQHQFTLISDQAVDRESLPSGVEWLHVATDRPTVQAAAAEGRRSLRDMVRMSRALGHRDFDVVFFPTVYSYVPVWSRSRKIVMIHDVIVERFPQLTLPNRAARTMWQAKVALARYQADALVTVSEHSQDEIANFFRVDRDRIHVVGEASDPIFRRLDPSCSLPVPLQSLTAHRLLIYVGGFNPHKNLETLLRAFASLSRRSECRDVRLVLVGDVKNRVFHSYIDTVRQMVCDLQIEGQTVFTGYLDDDELVRLMNHGRAVVLPSLLEGFGLPAIEGAACGLPVIATTASPLPKLIGEGGIFVDPHDLSGWEQAMGALLEDDDLQRTMGTRAYEAARRLTWDDAALQMISVIEQVASTGRTANAIREMKWTGATP